MPNPKMSEKVKSRVKSSDSGYSAIPPGLSVEAGGYPQYQLGANIQLCAVRRITERQRSTNGVSVGNRRADLRREAQDCS